MRGGGEGGGGKECGRGRSEASFKGWLHTLAVVYQQGQGGVTVFLAGME